MASSACRATVGASPGGARLLFQVGLAPLNSSMSFRPHRPDLDVSRKRPITGWTLFHEPSRSTFALQAANPLVLSLMPSLGRRYVCITLAGITQDGCLSCNTGASPRYDLHKPLSVRIFFSTSHFE